MQEPEIPNPEYIPVWESVKEWISLWLQSADTELSIHAK